MRLSKIGLLPRIIIAIILGIGIGLISPDGMVRAFVTFNDLFGNFLGFVIPLIILGFVAPGIADLGKGAGKLLGITALIAYGFTIFSGFFTFSVSQFALPKLLTTSDQIHIEETVDTLTPFFTVEMPPLMGVMSALVAAFALGLGMASIKGTTLKNAFEDFKEVVEKIISVAIIPLLPLYIFGIFLKMTASGQVLPVLSVFIKVILIIFFLTVVLLFIQFTIAAWVSKQNAWKLLKNMFPAYMTALGTQSSAATIPVTLEQTIKNGVDEDLAGFVVPLCATIHLSGSTMKIVACAMAIMMLSGMPVTFGALAGFILMLGIAMVAAPGVPGGAIMAALGILESMLGFSAELQGLMIALYIAMDSFGTATNVTGDGAIAVIVNKIAHKKG
ncbi:dicarboxylate/amino acid:cation symporter [Saccharicrinis aurantiacus]|uniref:dicarboxylate/amino acid:cation symporter n=1 Tax=Saccharicrinis aurantiacus TaxID=1849719 RepID=UPI00083885DB|nr:dicarboxylate/amino acid:cation symporter [Saccharicrinis aurantiacus]